MIAIDAKSLLKSILLVIDAMVKVVTIITKIKRLLMFSLDYNLIVSLNEISIFFIKI